MPILKKGLVQIYTGPGKGKTTAALGLAWRMLGWGGKVYICQFCKPATLETGEANLAKSLPGLTLERLEQPWDMRKHGDPRQARAMHEALSRKLAQIAKLVSTPEFDLVILDELVFCLESGLARREDVYAILDQRAPATELVLTGRGADADLIGRADLVTRMEELKHPFAAGFTARAGIEF